MKINVGQFHKFPIAFLKELFLFVYLRDERMLSEER